MKERPILFSGPMVRAILEGRKTQTRRIVKPQPVSNGHGFNAATSEIRCHCDYLSPDCLVQPPHYDDPFLDQVERKCPYGEPGDTLWCKETWAVDEDYDDLSVKQIGAMRTIENRALNVWYRADGDPRERGEEGGGRWRPSIHCFRWASRITLRVTSVRVEQLQSITEEDALAEGIGALSYGGAEDVWLFDAGDTRDPRTAFHYLWDEINGERASWESNPWVWVVGFERVEDSP